MKTGHYAHFAEAVLETVIDPEFTGKVRDVVGLHLDPPDKAPVLAVDEKSQTQALNCTAPCLPVLLADRGTARTAT